MAGPGPTSETAVQTTSPFGPGVPPLPENATPEQKDEHWYKHVYQGDKMPQLTLRAVLTGGILGMLLAASNLYTTLNIGWAFGVAKMKRRAEICCMVFAAFAGSISGSESSSRM